MDNRQLLQVRANSGQSSRVQLLTNRLKGLGRACRTWNGHRRNGNGDDCALHRGRCHGLDGVHRRDPGTLCRRGTRRGASSGSWRDGRGGQTGRSAKRARRGRDRAADPWWSCRGDGPGERSTSPAGLANVAVHSGQRSGRHHSRVVDSCGRSHGTLTEVQRTSRLRRIRQLAVSRATARPGRRRVMRSVMEIGHEPLTREGTRGK